MLKVGDFSKLANVTVKALRHYDSLGLLKPVWIDRFSGYRYYNLDQLPRLNRILALKDMGFTLEQIGSMLDANLPAEALRRIFDQKQQELQQRLQDEQERLNRVAERLRQIELEGRLPDVDIMVKAIPQQHVVSQRCLIPTLSALPARTSRMRAEIQSWAALAGLRSRGQWMLLYHQSEYRLRNLDIEVALVVDEPPQALRSAPQASLSLECLPEEPRMACALFSSSPHPLGSAYATLYAWAERNRYFVGGPGRELPLEDPAQPRSGNAFTEVQVPIATAQELKQKLFANPYRKESEMEPKFVDLPAFTLVGSRYYGKNEHQEISALWGEFNEHSGAIRHVTANTPAYGLCTGDPKAANGEFEYVAAFQVDQAADIPEGMVVRQVPAAHYAVFTHVGSLAKLSDTYHYIYQVWLPQSGYKIKGGRGGLDFELYDNEFKDFAPDSRFYIYVPVE